MLERGGHVPHFIVTGLDGGRVEYAAIWQRKHLVLVSLDDAEPTDEGSYVSELAARAPELTVLDANAVFTRDVVPGVPRPGILLADRWGEVQAVIPRAPAEGPSPDELVDWVSYLQSRCPECEGETR